jgi:hypothetical protein
VSEALRAGLLSGNEEVRAFFWLYLPRICGDLGLTSPELPHTEAAVCLGILADRFLLFSVTSSVLVFLSLISLGLSHPLPLFLLGSFTPPPANIFGISRSPVWVQAGDSAAPRPPQGRGRLVHPVVRRV